MLNAAKKSLLCFAFSASACPTQPRFPLFDSAMAEHQAHQYGRQMANGWRKD